MLYLTPRKLDMSRKALILATAFLAATTAVEAGTFKKASEEKGVPGEYLVVLREHAAKLSLNPERTDLRDVRTVAGRLARMHGIKVLSVWDRALPGFLISATEPAARRLAEDPRVEAVEQNAASRLEDMESSPAGSCYGLDSYFYGSLFYRTPPTASPQTITCSDPHPAHDTGGSGQQPQCQDNWGLDRIDQRGTTRDGLYTYERTGIVPGQVNVRIFVMDTGINAPHKEFLNAQGTASRAGAFDVTGDTSCAPTTDAYGHGTHVSGIAAGRTFGVAKDATITLVRIANCNGVTFTSWIVDGLNQVAGQRPSVLNWSGGNDQTIITSQAVRTAVQGVVNSGVMVVQAAGNQSSPYPQPGVFPATYPTGVEDACSWTFGTIPGVLVVGGMDQNNARWTRYISGDLVEAFCPPDCGSNIGYCIDVWAPAANILSAGQYDIYGYCRLSGTSMAAPHAAGVAALYLQTHPLASATEVEAAVIASATTGVLNTNTSSPNHIGTTSPNRLLYSKVP